jgi:hypothetical protein
MTTPGAGPTRLVRAAVLTALVVALTIAAHRLGGGASPAIFALVALTALLWPVALLATRRRLGPVGLLVGLGAGQLLGHGLLGWLAGPGVSGTSASVSLECLQHAAHQRASTACLGDPAVAEALAAGQAHAHGQQVTGLLMLAAHLLATVVAALLVARGEQVLWRLIDLVLRALPVLLTPVGARRPRPAATLLVPARADLAVRPGRGPPAYAA